VAKPKQRRRFQPPPPPPPKRRLPVRRRSFWAGIAVGLGVSAAFLTLTYLGRPSAPKANAPWGAGTAGLRDRLRRLGLQPLAFQGEVQHTHQHVDLYLNGVHVALPAGIGIGRDASGRFFSPLHTHDRTGIVHVESTSKRTYTLGQFFGVWGVRLDASCIDGDCAGGGRSLRAYVDGRRYHGDPGRIPLTRHEEIVLAYGTRAQLPARIPSSYRFPAG
jgi:hypothetical protein